MLQLARPGSEVRLATCARVLVKAAPVEHARTKVEATLRLDAVYFPTFSRENLWA